MNLGILGKKKVALKQGSPTWGIPDMSEFWEFNVASLNASIHVVIIKADTLINSIKAE